MRRPPIGAGGRRVDLHAHTYFSDGLLSPEELVERAIQRQLAAIAITDHDSVEGLPRARAAAGAQLEVVPGIEISSAAEEQDLHILGYYLDPDHPPLLQRLVSFQADRRARAREIIGRLAGQGIALDADAMLAAAGPGVVGRPHVAAALIAGGHVGDMDEAFRRYLGMRGSAYVPRPAFRPEEAIALIHAANGISVLAHPGPAVSDALFERLVQGGLRGVEVWHPLHGSALVRRYHTLAQRHDLVETGGSDFHSPTRGTELGDLGVSITVLDRLKQVAGVAG
jgi:predicted metal-dependent phosphoesterase TrpH